MSLIESDVKEFFKQYLGEDIGGGNFSGNFQGFAPEHMLGSPVTLNRGKNKWKKNKNLNTELKPFPHSKETT